MGRTRLLRLGGEGEPVEWVLRMRRFDQARHYDRMAEMGRLEVEAMPPLANAIAAFHAAADRTLAPEQATLPLEDVLRDNAATFDRNWDAKSRKEKNAPRLQTPDSRLKTSIIVSYLTRRCVVCYGLSGCQILTTDH